MAHLLAMNVPVKRDPTWSDWAKMTRAKIKSAGIPVSKWQLLYYHMTILFLDYHGVCLESVMCAIDADLTEKDAIYSPSGTHLLQLPDLPRYRIKEGTLFICPCATRHCKRLRELDVPKDLVSPYEALSDYPYRLNVKVWETHYDGTTDEEDDDSEDERYKMDDYGVNYSQDGKILKCCRLSFNETHYEVPDGVKGIDFGAFGVCRHFLELSIPRSVKFIGDSIFGNDGGVIIIRD